MKTNKNGNNESNEELTFPLSFSPSQNFGGKTSTSTRPNMGNEDGAETNSYDYQRDDPILHLAAHMTPEEVHRMLLLQQKLSSAPSNRLITHSLPCSSSSTSTISSNVRDISSMAKRLRITSSRNHRTINEHHLLNRRVLSRNHISNSNVSFSNNSSLYLSSNDTNRNFIHGSELLSNENTRKRKRALAKIDQKQVLQCLICGDTKGGGYKYGDYVLCSSCGSNDFVVVKEWKPNTRNKEEKCKVLEEKEKM